MSLTVGSLFTGICACDKCLQADLTFDFREVVGVLANQGGENFLGEEE